nr:DUF2382 domain-containing protein [Sodalis glossinidius]
MDEDVEAEVALHEQHANIFRRARDEAAYLDEVDWSDKTIEVTETREEPVIIKPPVSWRTSGAHRRFRSGCAVMTRYRQRMRIRC